MRSPTNLGKGETNSFVCVWAHAYAQGSKVRATEALRFACNQFAETRARVKHALAYWEPELALCTHLMTCAGDRSVI